MLYRKCFWLAINWNYYLHRLQENKKRHLIKYIALRIINFFASRDFSPFWYSGIFCRLRQKQGFKVELDHFASNPFRRGCFFFFHRVTVYQGGLRSRAASLFLSRSHTRASTGATERTAAIPLAFMCAHRQMLRRVPLFKIMKRERHGNSASSHTSLSIHPHAPRQHYLSVWCDSLSSERLTQLKALLASRLF